MRAPGSTDDIVATLRSSASASMRRQGVASSSMFSTPRSVPRRRLLSDHELVDTDVVPAAEPTTQVGERHRTGDPVSLGDAAAERGERVPDGGVLDALRNHVEPELMGECDQRRDDQPIAWHGGQVGDEVAVDLDPIDLEQAQRLVRRIADTEVVDRDSHTLLAE